MRLLLALLGAVAAIGLAAPVHADPDIIGDNSADDNAFLAALSANGISYANQGQVIASGRAVCECLINGESGLELVHDIKTHNPGMDMEQASQFAMLASKFYCPQELSKA